MSYWPNTPCDNETRVHVADLWPGDFVRTDDGYMRVIDIAPFKKNNLFDTIIVMTEQENSLSPHVGTLSTGQCLCPCNGTDEITLVLI